MCVGGDGWDRYFDLFYPLVNKTRSETAGVLLKEEEEEEERNKERKSPDGTDSPFNSFSCMSAHLLHKE